MFQPIELSIARAERSKSDSDTAYFYDLMILGEHVTKVVVLAIIAGIGADRDRHRYRLQYEAISSDGIGAWCSILADALTGPAAHLLTSGLQADQRAILQNVGPLEWQHIAVRQLSDLLENAGVPQERLSTKLNLLKWFGLFAALRNRTRAHGATTGDFCAHAATPLAESIGALIASLPLLSASWVYLHRNLSGKYRVVSLGGDQSPFSHLRTTAEHKFENGVYLHAGTPLLVDLIETDSNVADFFVPNGAFNGKKFELLSYLSDVRRVDSSGRFLVSPSKLPASETEGFARLDVVGSSFSNIPALPPGYVERPELQQELEDVLQSDRHQIVTLSGRGGIGKTSTALRVLRAVCEKGQFAAVVWFSARDIDLMPSGPKLVSPGVTSELEIASHFSELVLTKGEKISPKEARSRFEAELSRGSVGRILFVFDNFETVRNPQQLYAWLDAFIRPPNKILITTRFREFKGDYGVTVGRMTNEQCKTLILQTSQWLGIEGLLEAKDVDAIIKESDGHPYVIKVLLGEVSRERRKVDVRRVVANSDAILDSLFERTYQNLSIHAQRVFLLLCSWRSAVLEAAVEAVMLRAENERIDVGSAIDELARMSLVELQRSADESAFITVPLAAQVFGKRKLSASPLQAIVKADFDLLQAFGAAQESEMITAGGQRIERFFREIARRIADRDATVDGMRPVLEFLCRGYLPGWLLLADLLEEFEDLNGAQAAVRRFIEQTDDDDSLAHAWERAARIASVQRDALAELDALVRLGTLASQPWEETSRCANRINGLFKVTSSLVGNDDRRVLLQPLIDRMKKGANFASATDLSRLAWLCLSIQDTSCAKHFVRSGLEIDPGNLHLLRLATKLTM